MVPGMRDDAVHVALNEPGEPLEVPVAGAAADLDYPLHGIAHALLLPVGIGPAEHLTRDVAGGKELVLRDQLLVALPGPSLLQDLLLAEEGASP